MSDSSSCSCSCPSLTRTTIICILLSIFSGCLFGLNTGYVPAATVYNTELLNCTAYQTKNGCLAATSRTNCQWLPPPPTLTEHNSNNDTASSTSGPFCFFSDFPAVNCSRFSFTSTVICTNLNQTSSDDGEADNDSPCHFNVHTKICSHKVSWSAVRQGIFAGSLIVGATIGALVGGKAANHFGRKPTFIFLAVLALVGLVAEALCYQFDTFPGLIASRVVIGISVGLVSVVNQLFVGEMMRAQTSRDLLERETANSVAVNNNNNNIKSTAILSSSSSTLNYNNGAGNNNNPNSRTPRGSNANFVYESEDDPRYLYSTIPTENDQSRFSETVGVIFQVCVTSSVFVTSLLLLAVKIDYLSSDQMLLVERFHLFHIITALNAIFILVVSISMNESSVWIEMNEHRKLEREAKLHEADFSDAASSVVPSFQSPTPNDPRSDYDDPHHQNYISTVSNASSLATIQNDGKKTTNKKKNKYGNNDENINNTTTAAPLLSSSAVMSGGITLDFSSHDSAKQYSFFKVFALAFSLAAILQLTGVNALLNFAPTIVASVGLSPTIGNLIVLALFWLSTLVTFPISRCIKPWSAYVYSTIAISVACVLLALASFKELGLDSTEVLIIGGIGLVTFATAFHAGVGPFYFILASGVFPVDQRDFGCSLAMLLQFVLNILVNVFFPIAVNEISGGDATSNNDKGLMCAFWFFAGCGLLFLMVFVKLAPRELIRPK